MAFLIALSGAVLAALTNLIFRRSTVQAKSAHSFLTGYFLSAFILSLVFSAFFWTGTINFLIAGIGALVGLLNVAMMYFTAESMRKGGPSGLVFAFQNASAVFPGFLLFLIFGVEFGFFFSSFHLLGILLVLCGLFVGAQLSSKESTLKETKSKRVWLQYACACFGVQLLALTLLQGRTILFEYEGWSDSLSFLSLDRAEDVWFMPGQFGGALFLQAFLLWKDRAKSSLLEVGSGMLGGCTNCLVTICLLLATQYALPSQKIILIPCFAVGTIVLCNLWAKLLYQEKFQWTTNALCSSGILVGILAEI